MNRRIRQSRRDRRKAKQTNWARPGTANPKKVGHGGAGDARTTQHAAVLLSHAPSVRRLSPVQRHPTGHQFGKLGQLIPKEIGKR